MLGHSGGLPGFGSQWRIMPDYGIGVFPLLTVPYAPMGFVNLAVLDTLVRIAQLMPWNFLLHGSLNKERQSW